MAARVVDEYAEPAMPAGSEPVLTLRTGLVMCALCAMTSLGIFGFGCGRQAEGERCDTFNNNDDCADGLGAAVEHQMAAPGGAGAGRLGYGGGHLGGNHR